MKNNKPKIVFTVATLILTIGVYAQGGQGRGQGGGRGQQRGAKPDASEILSKLDTNNDEVIDKDEASKDERGKLAEHFDEIDTNSDEVLDLEELKDALNNRKRPKIIVPEKIIKEVDDDGNGKLNELELAVKKKQKLIDNFSEIDTNQDNELDLEELKAFYSKNVEEGNRKKRRRRD